MNSLFHKITVINKKELLRVSPHALSLEVINQLFGKVFGRRGSWAEPNSWLLPIPYLTADLISM